MSDAFDIVLAPFGGSSEDLGNAGAGVAAVSQPVVQSMVNEIGKDVTEKVGEAKVGKINSDRADYVARSRAKAGRLGLVLTDAERVGAGVGVPGGQQSPYPFVTG